MAQSTDDQSSFSDAPKIRLDQDRLGYSEFAGKIAKGIITIPASKGATLAIYGEWGSGKTTLINFVLEHLKKLPPADQPVVVHFNPWWFSGQDSIARKFFDTLLRELKVSGFKHTAVSSIKAISDVLGNVPEYGWIAKAAAATSSSFKDDTLSELRLKASDALVSQTKRILLIVDDVDRLLPEEILTTFKLTKLFTDLPNVVCVVAMDRDVVVHALDSSHGASKSSGDFALNDKQLSYSGNLTMRSDNEFGADFLDKIVQAPFVLPIPDEYSLSILFEEAIDEVCGTDFMKTDRDYFRGVYSEGLELLLDTPRKIARFRNSLEITFAAVKGEVHIVDFISIEAIRLYCHEAYSVMRENPIYFTGSGTFEKYDSPKLNEVRDFHKSWLRRLPAYKRVPVQNILVSLFPKVERGLRDDRPLALYGPKSSQLLARIDEQYGIYFTYSVSNWHVSNNELNLIQNADEQGILTKLRELAGSKTLFGGSRLVSFLERDRFLYEFSDTAKRNVVWVLLSFGDEFLSKQDYGKGVLSMPIGNGQRIQRILYLLVRDLPEATQYELVKRALIEGESLGTICWFILTIDEHLKNPERMPGKPIDFTAEQKSELRTLAVKRIQELQFSALIACPEMRFVIRLWKLWDAKGLRLFGEKLMKSTPDAMSFLQNLRTTHVFSNDADVLDATFGIENLIANIDNVAKSKAQMPEEYAENIEYARECHRLHELKKSQASEER